MPFKYHPNDFKKRLAVCFFFVLFFKFCGQFLLQSIQILVLNILENVNTDIDTKIKYM